MIIYDKKIPKPDIKTETPEYLLKLCSMASGIPESNLVSKERTAEIVVIRHLFCYIANSISKISLKKIAKCINRDHTSVIHAREKVIDYLNAGHQDYSDAFNKIIERIKQEYEIPLLNDKGRID